MVLYDIIAVITGMITIEAPERVSSMYQNDSEKKAKELIESLDKIRPRKKKLRDLSDVAGMWSFRKESAEEIARELRRKNNRAWL